MIRIGVLADCQLLAELVAEVLRQDRHLAVTSVVGDRAGLQSPAVREGLETAQVLLYVPLTPIETLPWRERVVQEHQALVLADLSGQLGVYRALQLGARGYVGPRETPAILIQRVLQAAEGALAIPAGALAELQGVLHRLASEEQRAHQLTQQQIQIVRWVAQGETGKEIQARLGISLSAARSRIRRIMEKLDVSNERELAAWAAPAGLYPEEH